MPFYGIVHPIMKYDDMNRTLQRMTWLCLFFFPLFSFCQENDPGTRQTRDSLAKQHDSARLSDSSHQTIRHAADSAHYTDTVHYHFSYSGTGTINHTNNLSSYVFSNSLQFSAVKKSAALNFSNNWLYGHQSRSLTNNDFTSTADLSLYKTLRHFYYWGLVNYNTSLSLQINHLIQSGFGAGYNILDKKTAVLILSDGVLYEKGDLYDILYGGPNGDVPQRDRYQVLRNSFRIKYHVVIRDLITLNGTEFLQTSLADGSNYILKLSAAASFKLYKWLNFTTAFLYNKFTRTRSENTLMTFGLTIAK